MQHPRSVTLAPLPIHPSNVPHALAHSPHTRLRRMTAQEQSPMWPASRSQPGVPQPRFRFILVACLAGADTTAVPTAVLDD
eukprot:2830281-Prymnesium_polylepis.1